MEKALLDLLTELARAKALDSITEIARSKLEHKGRVQLDGFDLFMPGAYIKPYSWFLLKPNANIAEMLKTYERAVMQMGSGFETTGDTLGSVFSRNSEERRLFSRLAKDQRWSAFCLFAAAAQHLGAERSDNDPDKVSLRLGSGLIEVSKDGVWSNRMSGLMRFPDKDLDMDVEAGVPVTTFPAIETDNYVLKALYEMTEESNSRYAVTVAAYAMKEEIVGKSFFDKIARLEHELVEKARYVKRDPEKAAAALDRCIELLNTGTYDIIPHLFEEAVPDLISYKRLQSLLGAPNQVRAGRAIKETTLMNWQMRLEAELERVRDAVT